MDEFWGYVAMAIVQGLVTKVFGNRTKGEDIR
jgi:hypothetical protein